MLKTFIAVVQAEKGIIVPSTSFVASGILLEALVGEEFEFEEKNDFVVDTVVQPKQLAQRLAGAKFSEFLQVYAVILGDSISYLGCERPNTEGRLTKPEKLTVHGQASYHGGDSFGKDGTEKNNHDPQKVGGVFDEVLQETKLGCAVIVTLVNELDVDGIVTEVFLSLRGMVEKQSQSVLAYFSHFVLSHNGIKHSPKHVHGWDSRNRFVLFYQCVIRIIVMFLNITIVSEYFVTHWSDIKFTGSVWIRSIVACVGNRHSGGYGCHIFGRCVSWRSPIGIQIGTSGRMWLCRKQIVVVVVDKRRCLMSVGLIQGGGPCSGHFICFQLPTFYTHLGQGRGLYKRPLCVTVTLRVCTPS